MSIKTASAEASAASGGSRAYLFLLTGVAALGGLLFGYDTAVISGAVGFLQKHFHLSAGLTGWAASSVLVGAMIGAAAGGPLSDRVGRRPVLLLAVCFAVRRIRRFNGPRGKPGPVCSHAAARRHCHWSDFRGLAAVHCRNCA